MSVADKLTAIAENMQKVYDAGRAAGGGGSALVLEELTITENGEYTPPAGVDGFSKVTVNVPSGGEEVFWGEVNTTAPTHGTTMYTKNVVFPHETITIPFYSQCTELETFEAPYFTGNTAHSQFFNCAKLRSLKFPRLSRIHSQYLVRQQGVVSQIEDIQFGSIGYPFREFAAANWNYGNNHSGCTITFYVDATTIEEAHASITNWGTLGVQNTSNCTFVFRNSTTGEVITE